MGIHWGVEYKNTPEKYQTDIADRVIALGADVIAGHHPHWVQTTEKINDKSVYYSLGNFVFDQMWSEETKKGMVIELLYQGNELIKETKRNTYIKNIGQPEFVD